MLPFSWKSTYEWLTWKWESVLTSNRWSFLILCRSCELYHTEASMCAHLSLTHESHDSPDILNKSLSISSLVESLLSMGQAHILPSQNQFDKMFIQLSSVALSRVGSQHCHARHAHRESQNCSFINTSLSKAVIGRSTNLSTFGIQPTSFIQNASLRWRAKKKKKNHLFEGK